MDTSTTENIALSLERLRLATSQIRKLEIEATPQNYTLWYEYFSGQNKALNSELDQLIKDRRTFDSKLCAHLYSTHLGADTYQALQTLRSSIKELINSLTNQLQNLSGNLKNFESELENSESALSNDPDIQALSVIIHKLLAATKEQKHSANRASEKVNELNKEIEFLKGSLEHMTEEVYIDALTQIANRKAYDMEIVAAIQKSKKYDRPLAMVVMDIDHFKRFNDTYGHVVGDQVLRFVASKFTANIKGQDFVARFGGEEFVMILPNTDVGGAKAITKKILAKIAKSKLRTNNEGESVGAVTLSAGIAALEPNDSAESLFDRADKSLLKAKSNGRNSIIVEGK